MCDINIERTIRKAIYKIDLSSKLEFTDIFNYDYYILKLNRFYYSQIRTLNTYKKVC